MLTGSLQIPGFKGRLAQGVRFPFSLAIISEYLQGENSLRIISKCIILMISGKAKLIFFPWCSCFHGDCLMISLAQFKSCPGDYRPFACQRIARLGENPSSFGAFLHKYSWALLYLILALLLLLTTPHPWPGKSIQVPDDASKAYVLPSEITPHSFISSLGDFNSHWLPYVLYSFST